MKSLWHPGYLFAEVNVQPLLIKENLKIKRMYLAANIVFLHPRERDHAAALLTLKAKWFATLT